MDGSFLDASGAPVRAQGQSIERHGRATGEPGLPGSAGRRQARDVGQHREVVAEELLPGSEGVRAVLAENFETDGAEE